jgi:hypothetical protein
MGHPFISCVCEANPMFIVPVPVIKLHGSTGYQKVDDAIHKSAEYCSKQRYIISRYNKFDDINNYRRDDKTC